jgi:hypothetical protein
VEANSDKSVETSLIEEVKDDRGSMEEDANGRGRYPWRAASQGQAMLNDSMDSSNGHAYSFFCTVPGSDEQDLIHNDATNESINEDKEDNEQGTKPASSQGF